MSRVSSEPGEAIGQARGRPEDSIPRQAWRRLTETSAAMLARQVIFVAVLLVAWVTLKPFADLSGFGAGDIVTGQEAVTYALFSLFALASFCLVLPDHRRALVSLLGPALLALLAWLCVSVLYSVEPATSAKRLTLTLAVFVVAACLPLLPPSRDALRNLLAAACLILLGLCYAGLFVLPELAIHQLTDNQEPALAGAWRGTFGHKNAAAAVFAMMLFIGVGVFRAGGRIAGAAILLLAAMFLIGSEGKSSFGLSLAVFAITGSFVFVRSFAGRAIVAFGSVALINAFTLGSVMNDTLGGLVAQLPIDTTFTGRANLWRFALEHANERLLLGHGFSAFWKTEATVGLAEGSADWELNWAGSAAHSHNGYLDSVLSLGLVGLALTLVVLVWKPLRDFHGVSLREGAPSPFATMFLQIWLFGLLLSSMESFFYDRSDAIWVTFLFAIFGLHYLARFRAQ